MCNLKSSQTALRQQISDQSADLHSSTCVSEQFRIYQLEMELLGREQKASLTLQTITTMLIENNSSKENRTKI